MMPLLVTLTLPPVLVVPPDPPIVARPPPSPPDPPPPPTDWAKMPREKLPPVEMKPALLTVTCPPDPPELPLPPSANRPPDVAPDPPPPPTDCAKTASAPSPVV